MKIALIVTILQIFSKIFGFIRELTLSYFYGVSEVSDAFLVAFALPSALFLIINPAITAGYIPIYNKIKKKEGREEANLFTINCINIILILCFIISLFFYFNPEIILKIFATGFKGKKFFITLLLSRISVWSIILISVNAIFITYLNANNSFILPSFVSMFLNFGIIIGIFLSEKYGYTFLSFGILMGFFMQFILLYIFAKRKGLNYKPYLNLSDKYTKEIYAVSIIMLISAGADQFNSIVDRSLASYLTTGSISALNYAQRLNSFIISIFILPIISLIYPKLSNLALENRLEDFFNLFYKTISFFTFITAPLVFGGMYFSKEVTGLLFLRGAFDYKALNMTSSALFYYLIGIIFTAYREVLFRAFYSLGKPKIPVKNTIMLLGFNIIFNLILSRYMGAPGIALATSISSIIATSVLMAKLIKLKKHNTFKILKNISKVLICSIFMIILLNMLEKIYPIEMEVVNLFFHILIGAMIFIGSAFVLKVEELKILKRYKK